MCLIFGASAGYFGLWVGLAYASRLVLDVQKRLEAALAIPAEAALSLPGNRPVTALKGPSSTLRGGCRSWC